MKKLTKNLMNARVLLGVKAMEAKEKMTETAGEGYVDTAIKILIAVVLGALLLAGLYSLFNDTVLPTLVKRVQDMFNYAG